MAVPLPELAWITAATALLNNGMAIDEMGPASSPMEEAVMRSIAQYMGLGDEASGILCHGGTLANLTALLAARQCQSERDEWREGTTEKYAVLVSEQAHYCVDRAVRVRGWGGAGAREGGAEAGEGDGRQGEREGGRREAGPVRRARG